MGLVCAGGRGGVGGGAGGAEEPLVFVVSPVCQCDDGQAWTTPVQLSDKLTDLGVESLDVIEMIMELEEKFDIHIPFNANDTEMKDFQSVGDIVRAIETLVAKKT